MEIDLVAAEAEASAVYTARHWFALSSDGADAISSEAIACTGPILSC